ncbi:uncharacterized protein LOC132197926 [Neocloeon triangulifer]|uniref:uncharacterized protein LOC132197926 n=1 Tax=Neocloeon triangulifer TaxID=2078957 RepID=UPI00286F2A55|nr:uncharacterized protein LOC132197926 [Neocloeon triangulifer]
MSTNDSNSRPTKRGRYKLYNEDSNAKIPKTTAWRLGLRQMVSNSELTQQCTTEARVDCTIEDPNFNENFCGAGDEEKEDVDFDNQGDGFVNENLANFLKSNSQSVNFNVKYSPNEISFLLLTLSISQNFTLTSTCKLFRLMNVILGTDVFPNTKFEFEKIFNPSIKTDFNYACKSCGNLLGCKDSNVDVANIKCCCGALTSRIGIQSDETFITLNIESQLAHLFDIGAISCEPLEPNTKCNDITGGTLYREIDSKIRTTLNGQGKNIYLSCVFNADGAPMDNSSSITPIFRMINEANFKFRGKNLILAALWYGGSKPRMEVFLKPFVKMMKKYSEEGVTLNIKGEQVTIYLTGTCCCVDSVTRAQIQGVTGVNDHFCCSWCLIKGVATTDKSGRAVVKYAKKVLTNLEPLTYIYYVPNLRTEKNFASAYENLFENEFEKLDGVGIVSPCIDSPEFKMVWGFIPDYVHCVLLGTTRRFIKICSTHEGSKYFFGDSDTIQIIDNYLKNIRPPKIVQKVPLLISMQNLMNSREAENWLLFYSVPILSQILPTAYVQHWKLLVGSMQLLLQDEVSATDVEKAEKMLEIFTADTEKLYGTCEMTYDIHQLTHFGQSVRLWGPLWAHTAYPFEAALKTSKKIIEDTKGVPHQIVQRINLTNCLSFMERFIDVKDEELQTFCHSLLDCRKVTFSKKSGKDQTLLGKNQPSVSRPPNFPRDVNFYEYEKVVSKGVLYSKAAKKKAKFDDSYIVLKNGRFCHIVNIISEGNLEDVYLIVRYLVCIDVENLIGTKKIAAVEDEEKFIKLEKVKGPAVYVKIKNDSGFDNWITVVPRKHFLMNM